MTSTCRIESKREIEPSWAMLCLYSGLTTVEDDHEDDEAVKFVVLVLTASSRSAASSAIKTPYLVTAACRLCGESR
jgi:hypothetical protein